MDFPTLATIINITTAIPAIGGGLIYGWKWRNVAWRWGICLVGAIMSLYTAIAYYLVLTDTLPPQNPPLNVVLLRWTLAFWHCFFVVILVLISTVETMSSDAECQKALKRIEDTLVDKIQAIETKDKVIEILQENNEKLKGELKQLKAQ